jgi:hypothetical protein
MNGLVEAAVGVSPDVGALDSERQTVWIRLARPSSDYITVFL